MPNTNKDVNIQLWWPKKNKFIPLLMTSSFDYDFPYTFQMGCENQGKCGASLVITKENFHEIMSIEELRSSQEKIDSLPFTSPDDFKKWIELHKPTLGGKRTRRRHRKNKSVRHVPKKKSGLGLLKKRSGRRQRTCRK